VADLLEDGVEAFSGSEAQGALAVVSGVDDFSLEQRRVVV
jgi:hypothetical protein